MPQITDVMERGHMRKWRPRVEVAGTSCGVSASWLGSRPVLWRRRWAPTELALTTDPGQDLATLW